MEKISVYTENDYIVLRIPLSEMTEDKNLTNLLEFLKATELKKRIKISEVEFEKLVEDFNGVLRRRINNWLKEGC